MEPKREPLTESYFYILLCLYSHANHGYGIMQEAGRLSGGTCEDRFRDDVWCCEQHDKEGLDHGV